MVKTFPGKAHSGDRVGVSTCEGLPGCGEAFPPPRLRGVLTNSASSVSAYVGYWDNPLFPNPGDTMQARIRAYNSDDELVSESGYVTVTSGATLTQQVTATAPAGERIAYFDVTADAGDTGGQDTRDRRRLDHDAGRPAAGRLHAQCRPDRRGRADRELGRRAGRPEPAERVERERLLRGLGPAHGDERRFQPEPAGGHRYQDHPYPQRRRGRGPLGPVHAYHGHGHAEDRGRQQGARDHQAGAHPRELRPDHARRLPRRAQRGLHAPAERPLGGDEHHGPRQRSRDLGRRTTPARRS